MEHWFIRFRHKLTIVLFVAVLSNLNVIGQTNSIAEKSDPKAVRMWEKAIKAKGGRERLESVLSLYVERIWSDCLEGCVEDRLYVFPDRVWLCDLTPFGKFEPQGNITIWNFGEKVRRKVLRNLNAEFREGYNISINDEREAFDKIHLATFDLLLETKWLKPVPLSVRKGWSGLRLVDIVRVRIPGSFDINTKDEMVIDLYLDLHSHLPIETRVVINGKSDKEFSVKYSDYVAVNGIMLPQKHTYWRALFADPDTKGSEVFRYQINVDVDEGIFRRSLNNHIGRYEWRKGR